MEPSHDEVLKLGPPATGEIVIKVDPRRTGSAFSTGTETLLPGAQIPVHRHRESDEVLFIHKGQGRATLEGKSMTVLPGMMLFVPRQAWHGLRNTGTGLLRLTWTSAPPGIEEFFREMSRLGPQADAAALNTLAQRHGLEFHPAGEAAATMTAAPRHRRRRHRRGRRGGSHGHGQPPPVSATPTPAAPVAPSRPTAVPAQLHRRSRRRRPHGRPPHPAPTGTAVPALPPSKAPPRRQRERSGRRRGRVKEVYMEGRWVQVTGEGPVIAPGRDRPREGRPRSRTDEDVPPGPLTVPL